MELNKYPFLWYHSLILGFLTPLLLLFIFYASAVYIDGVNDNYSEIFCN